MGYYMRGDYYRRGDIWSTIGGVVKGGLLGIAGGPAGVVAGAVSGLAGSLASSGGPTKPSGGGPSLGPIKLNPFMLGGGAGVIGSMFGAGKFKGGKRPKKGEPGWHPRRMHVTNPKALRRAIRRAQGFEKLAMKVLAFTRPHGRPKGHPHFRRRAKR